MSKEKKSKDLKKQVDVPIDFAEENKQLRHEVDTTRGLWCIDRDPKEVDIDWIRRNAFQLNQQGQK